MNPAQTRKEAQSLELRPSNRPSSESPSLQYQLRLLCGVVLLFVTQLVSIGCSQKVASFDLLAESTTFNQNSAEVNGKIDILWVIDNSGSMDTSQAAVAANFQRFIEKFRLKGSDYQMAVTTTEAYKDVFTPSLNLSRFSQGTYTDPSTNATVTAPSIITPSTPNDELAFIANIRRGITGSGDERAFQSLKAALNNTTNRALGFPRADAYFAVIILSDEDDFSWDGTGTLDNMYTDTRLHTIQSYVDFLDTLTLSTAGNRKYNVSSIAIQDDACRVSLGGGVRKISQRYQGLVNATNGRLESLCGDFGTSLSSISNKIIELSTQFYLTRTPAPGSLRVYVDGILVPEDSVNGYTYNSTNNSISFHGTAVPGAGAKIGVTYDPTELR